MSKKAILIVSFGTSFKDNMKKSICAIKNNVACEFKEYDVFMAFTSEIIVKKLRAGGYDISSVDEELKKIAQLGYEECYIQPTHIIAGFEYEKTVNDAQKYKDLFKVLKIGNPLLYDTDDFIRLIEIFTENIKTDEDEAVVLMGHGSEHFSNTAYAALDFMFKEKGFNNFFIGTVEAYPDLDTVIGLVKKAGYKKAVLQPLLIVAGDHAINDMAGDSEDSWINRFKEEGIDARAVLKGIGEYSQVVDMYISRIRNIL